MLKGRDVAQAAHATATAARGSGGRRCTSRSGTCRRRGGCRGRNVAGGEWTAATAATSAQSDVIGLAVSHHDEEGLRFSLGDQIVHDEIGGALIPPGRFI